MLRDLTSINVVTTYISFSATINFGLASQELFTLLSMYEVLIYMETNYDKRSDECIKATIMKVDIEYAIRREIFYRIYRDL